MFYYCILLRNYTEKRDFITFFLLTHLYSLSYTYSTINFISYFSTFTCRMTLNISMIPKIHYLYLAHVLCFLFLHYKTPHGCHFPPLESFRQWHFNESYTIYIFFKLTAEEIKKCSKQHTSKKKKKFPKS